MAKRRHYRDGSIYQRKSDKKWCAAYIQLDGKRRTLYAETREAIVERLERVKVAQRDGQQLPDQRLLTSTFLTAWIDQCQTLGNIAPATVLSYEGPVRLHLVPALGSIPLAKLSVDHVQRFINDNPHKLSPHALRYCRTVLRIALNVALRQRKVTCNVATLVDLPKEGQKPRRGRPFTPQETNVLLVDMARHRLYSLWLLELATGVRPHEALGLRWAAPGLRPDDGIIDLDSGVAHIRNGLHRCPASKRLGTAGTWDLSGLKTEESARDLRLPPVVVDALKQRRKEQLQERLQAGGAEEDGGCWHEDIPGLVFESETGSPLLTSTALHAFQKILARRGLLLAADGKKRRCYDLRHTAITWLLRNGLSLHEVRKVAGHASIVMTSNVYGDILDEGKRQAADIMQQSLARASAG